MATLTNTQEEALKAKLDLGCRVMLRQTVAADSWRLTAGGLRLVALRHGSWWQEAKMRRLILL